MQKNSFQAPRSKSSVGPLGATRKFVRSHPLGCKKRQKGNALWFILIVVALFGALTATLSRNTGNVNQAGDVEQARIRATSLLRYTAAVETAIQKMVLSGISQNDLDFKAIGSDYDNANCNDTGCEVFSIGGGGIPYRDLPSILSDDSAPNWVISAQNFVYLAGCDTSDNTCSDLLMIAPGIPKATCLQINTIQGITNTDGNPPQMESILTDEKFDGTFTSTLNTYSLGGTSATEATEVQGKNAACVEVSGTYYFYQLLHAQ